MAGEREEIARIIDPEIWADLEAVRGEGGPWGGYSGQARIDTSLSKADAILARQGPGPGEAVAWRPEVVAFANLMEAQLRANDHKGGWKGEEAFVLVRRLFEEANELADEFHAGSRTDVETWRASVGREAADVANFAMMIADVCGALAATPTREADHERP